MPDDARLEKLFSFLLKVICKDGKKSAKMERNLSWCSQDLWQAKSTEQSWKKYIEILGQQHTLYKYNPASPDSWFSWGDFPNRQHQAWWPWFSWLGVRSLADLKWQSCRVVSSSPKLAASILEQFWEVTASCSPWNTVHSGGKHSNHLCPLLFLFVLFCFVIFF